MALRISKQVQISEFKLVFLYYVLLAGVIVGLLFRFILSRGWLLEVQPFGVATSWASGMHKSNAGELGRVTDAAFGRPLCQTPGMFEFWWDQDFRFGPHECIRPCIVGDTRSPCLHPQEVIFQEARDVVFLGTEFTETALDQDSTSSYFIPFTDAFSLGFEYTFHVSRSNNFYGRFGFQTRMDASSPVDILTVIVTRDMSPYKVIEPAEALSLSLLELLELSGTSLDSFRIGAGKNMKPGLDNAENSTKGPLARVSGLDLDVSIGCYRGANYAPIELDGKWQDDWGERPVCVVGVQPTTTWWVGKLVTEPLGKSGSVRERRFHGVRVTFRVGGSYTFVDPNSIILTVVSFLVFLRVPALIIKFVATFMLGKLSTVYQSAIHEKLDILEQCTGMSARLLSMGAAFNELEDVRDSDDVRQHGISKERMTEQLMEVFKHQRDVLDQDEIARYVDCCYHTMVTQRRLREEQASRSGFKAKVRRLKDDLMRRSVGDIKNSAAKKDDVVTIDDFGSAHCSIERFPFETCINLFDQDRKVGFLERFFMPPNLKALVLEAAKTERRSTREAPRRQIPPAGLGRSTMESPESAGSAAESSKLNTRQKLEDLELLIGECRQAQASDTASARRDLEGLGERVDAIRSSTCTLGKRLFQAESTFRAANASEEALKMTSRQTAAMSSRIDNIYAGLVDLQSRLVMLERRP